MTENVRVGLLDFWSWNSDCRLF